MRYNFLCHELYHCESLCLKKYYGLICNDQKITDINLVVELAVGKIRICY